MIYLLGMFFVFLVILIPFLFYHAIQYTKKKDDKSVRGYIIEYHYRKMFEMGIVSIAIILAIGIMSTLI